MWIAKARSKFKLGIYSNLMSYSLIKLVRTKTWCIRERLLFEGGEPAANGEAREKYFRILLRR